MAQGLLKLPSATESNENMFELMMPENQPVAIGDYDDSKRHQDGYERRHYFTWTVEKRDLVESQYRTQGRENQVTKSYTPEFTGRMRSWVCTSGQWRSFQTKQTVSTTTETPYTVHYRSGFEPTDESIPFRIVGSYEYLKSLNELRPLVNSSTAEEINVYDKYLADRPELTVSSGSFLAKAEQPRPAPPQPQDPDAYKKHGLAWMITLAPHGTCRNDVALRRK